MSEELRPPVEPSLAPQRRRAPALLAAVLAGALAGGVGVWAATHRPHGGDHAGSKTAEQQPPQKKTVYQCPMHPSVTSDHPGDCPICGMALVEVPQGSSDAAPSGAGKSDRRIAFYRSPMDPRQTSPTPRKDEMGMDYVPVYEDEVQGKGGGAAEGLATVTIDPARQQMIGLRTAEVTRGPLGATWTTVGRVQVDPTRVRKINIKIEGYVERIFVDFAGRTVRKGEPLFSLYSPSLLAAQNELLLALQTRKQLQAAAGPHDGGGDALTSNGDALVQAARRKLELSDVPAAEIDRLVKTGEPSRTLTFVSPISGVVTAKTVVEGARLAPGDTPYEVTDLGMVWVMADAYETDLARVRVGMPATLAMKAYPDRRFKGRVAFLDPILDPKTRTLKVHLHFPNPTGELKPEMFGEVTLQGPPRTGLLIPTDAVIQSGAQEVVFVALGQGKFRPQVIRAGTRNGEVVEVQQGLEQGQQVVTRANFLIDSESRLRASLSALSGK